MMIRTGIFRMHTIVFIVLSLCVDSEGKKHKENIKMWCIFFRRLRLRFVLCVYMLSSFIDSFFSE